MNLTFRQLKVFVKLYPSQGVTHMLARGETPMHWKAVASEEQRRVGWRSHDGVFAAWREVAQVVAASPSRADRAMAVRITDFVQAMPIQLDAPGLAPRAERLPAREDRMSLERDDEPANRRTDIER